MGQQIKIVSQETVGYVPRGVVNARGGKKDWSWLTGPFDELDGSRAIILEPEQEDFDATKKDRQVKVGGEKFGIPIHKYIASKRTISRVRSALQKHNEDSRFRASVQMTSTGNIAVARVLKKEHASQATTRVG